MPKLKPGTIWPASAKVALTTRQIAEIAATSMTFDEVEAKYGEDVAIRVGAARDPDNPELTTGDFAQMRPAVDVVPDVVEAYRRSRGKQNAATKEKVTLRLDADVMAHFRQSGKGWQTRLNDTLRKAVLD